MMKIPNADFLERTESKILGARLWRLAPKSAMTLHKHPRMEEFYFVVEGVGRMRINEQTITVQRHGECWWVPSSYGKYSTTPKAKYCGLSLVLPKLNWSLGKNTTKHFFIR